MSQMQKKLLYNVVKSNKKILDAKNDDSVSFEVKRKGWKKIASKLNSTTGLQKSWSQWKKVHKFFLFRNVENMF